MDRLREHFSRRHYEAEAYTGPFSFLNPTARYLPVAQPGAKPGTPGPLATTAGPSPSAAVAPGAESVSDLPSTAIGSEAGASSNAETTASAMEKADGIYHLWRSRDNRKGRHAVVVTKKAAEMHGTGVPMPTNSLKETLRGLGKMCVRYPVWDVSYDVAVIFTLGSAIWVINAFFVWLPLAAPSTLFPGEETMGGGVSAFIGATVFELGSVFLMLEAVNENRSADFGWALEEAIEDGSQLVLRQDRDGCAHHHRQRSSWLRGAPEVAGGADEQERQQMKQQLPGGTSPDGQWSWWPTWYELRTHYIRDIGFLACSSQMLGATIFWIAGFTGLPPIYNSLSLPATNGVYWLPQVVGGTGFIVSSFLFMVETQPNWYTPAPKVLGWHIGLWNLVGAIGFTLCGALGFAVNDSPAFNYAATMSTFVGSWAFLIGSAIQWYESLDKYPISIEASTPQ